jgi:putative acyl-CoA dehydrogenase
MPLLYRDSPLASIWEGSGNVAALDVLRAMAKEPEGLPAFLAECELARGGNARFDEQLNRLTERLGGLIEPDADPEFSDAQFSARRVVEELAVTLQASLLVRNAPPAVADAFCAARLGDGGRVYGTLPRGVDAKTIVERVMPA